MAKKIHYYNQGELIVLFDKSKDKKIGGSLILEPRTPTPHVESEPKAQSNTQEKITTPAGILQQRISEKVGGLPEKVNNQLPKISTPKLPPTKLQKYMRSLAICLLVLSMGGIIYSTLPIAVTAFNQSREEMPAATEKLPVSLPTVEPALIPTAQPINWDDFYITIPKINIDSKIVANVDTTSMDEYQTKLLDNGVAHAKGSYLPGQDGPVVLFAHSTDSIANIVRFNAKFFAAKDLISGDEIVIQFNHKFYRYRVRGSSVIDPKDLDHVRESNADLVLSTCYPPGTSWQRLIIFADLITH